MFQILHRLWKEHNVSLSQFISQEYPLKGKNLELINELAREIKWKPNRKTQLYRRIQKLANNKDFTTRELKLVSKLVNKQIRDGWVDYEEIRYYFPGKTVQMCKDAYDPKRKYK